MGALHMRIICVVASIALGKGLLSKRMIADTLAISVSSCFFPTDFSQPGSFSVFGVQPCNAKLSESSITRFLDAQKELVSLDANFIDIATKRGGDGIREKLGTVYKPPTCSYNLCSFNAYMEKFIKTNVDEIDIDQLEDPSIALQKALNEADFDAYSANFADFGNGAGNYGASPKSDEWLDKSRSQIRQAIVAINEVIKVMI